MEAGPVGEAPVPAKEAQEALFDLDIGDAEVDFFLEGTWRASLYGSLGVLIAPDGQLIRSPFPGLETDRIFQQIPDLTFSVWLLNRMFIEASVIGDFLEQDYQYFDQNYILMGYLGAEEEFLRRILIGSKDVGIDPFPFLDIPEPGLSSLGVEAALGTGGNDHQLLLRYDNNEPDSLVFIGANLVNEQVITLDAYMRGRLFKLPDAGVENLEVYLEDRYGSFSDGEGRRYRAAALGDAELDGEAGTVFLKEPAEGAVLVYYEVAGSPVGSAGLGVNAFPEQSGQYLDLSGYRTFQWGQSFLGENLNDRQVVVAGNTCLRLYRPGEFSPFEILSGYALDAEVPVELSRLRVQLVRTGNRNIEIDSDVTFDRDPGDDFIRAYYEPDPDLRTEFRNLYPFLDQSESSPVFDPGNLLYGPLADAKPGYLGYQILVSELTPVNAYQIGSDAIPGSVQILRNGIAETRFEVDYERGVVTFLTPIAADDRLVVSFRRKSGLANNGDILFAWGNTLTLSEAMKLQLATGVRWNFLPGSFTDEAYSRTGSVILSAGLEGAIGPLSYEASLGGAYTNPDTTGVMRLLGMESTGREISLDEELAYPAAQPADDTDFVFALNANNRGVLRHEDYAYADGGKPGPYLSGDVLVAEFQLDASEWVGFQLPISYAQGLSDLSSYESVSLLYGTIDDPGDFEIYLQIGELGEDLDGDGLDQELSESANGFVFSDDTNLVDLRVGSGPQNTGNGFLDTEDVDGNGFLDPEDAAAVQNIVTTTAESVSGDTDPAVMKYVFSQADKARLKRVRGVRVLIADDSGIGGGASGRLLIGDISLQGSRFAAEGMGVTVAAREIEEQPADPQLADSFEQAYENFHPYDERQQILEVEWSGGAGTGQWSVRGYTEAQTEGVRYRNVVYYYRDPDGDGTTLEFSLLDSADRGIRWEFPPVLSDSWSEIRVSLEEGKVYRNGIELPGSAVTQNESARSLSVFTVSLTGADTGTLYLDELHLTDPVGSLGAAASLQLELFLPGSLLELGGHSVIHDLSFRQSASYATAGFATLYGNPAAVQSFVSVSELDLGLSLLDVSADFTLAAGDTQPALGGGHRLTVPNVPFPLVLFDSFSLRDRAAGTEMQRANALQLDLPPLLRLDLSQQAGNVEGVLDQSWAAGLGFTPSPISLQNNLEMAGSYTDYALPGCGYLDSWIRGYTLLVPVSDAAVIERTADLDLDWDLNTVPVGLQLLWRHGFQSYDFTMTERTLRSSAGMEIGIPVAVQLEGTTVFSLQSGYRRDLQVDSYEMGGGDFSMDLSGSFGRIYAQRYLYEQIPYLELYSAQAEKLFLDLSSGLEYAAYGAEAYLQMSRRFSSTIRDLLLPSSLEIAVRKDFVKDQDLSDLSNTYSLNARSTALNLFGDFGAYRLFPFYRSDEFSTSLTLSLEADGTGVQTSGQSPIRGWRLDLDHFFSFAGAGDGELTLENRLDLSSYRADEPPTDEDPSGRSWGNSVKLLYNWFRYPQTGVQLPLVPEKVGREGYWEHQESLEMELEGAVEQASYHPFNLVVSHESALLLPDFGEISAEIAAGVDVERTETGTHYWRLGLRGGLSVQIEF